MKADAPHSVIFRMRHIEADGTSTVEEREVRCDEAELARLLAEPWRNAPEQPATAPPAEALSEALAETLTSLALRIERRRDGAGADTWTLGFVTEDADASSGEGPAEGAGDGVVDAICSDGPVTVRARTDAVVSSQPGVLSTEHNSIHIEHQGLSVISSGNLAAIVNVVMEVHLDTG